MLTKDDEYLKNRVNKFIGIVNLYDEIIEWNIKITYSKAVFSSNFCNDFITNAKGCGEQLFYQGEFKTKENNGFVLRGDLSDEIHIKNSLEKGLMVRGKASQVKGYEIGQYPEVELASSIVKEIVLESNVLEIDKYIANMKDVISEYELSIEMDMKAEYIVEYFINSGEIICTSDETKISLFITMYSDAKVTSRTFCSRAFIDFSQQIRSFLQPYMKISKNIYLDGPIDITRVILSIEAVKHLMELIFINNIDGYEVGTNRSFINKKMLGQKVLGDFTITDDGILNMGIGSCCFDLEGAISQKTLLFKEGVFITPLINKSSINYYKEERLSLTGNAVNENYADVTNLFMTNEKHMVDDATLYSGDYVFIKGLRGYNGNPLNGDFRLESIAAEIYSCGKRIGVKDVILYGNLFEILNDENIFVSATKNIEKYNVPEISTQLVKLDY